MQFSLIILLFQPSLGDRSPSSQQFSRSVIQPHNTSHKNYVHNDSDDDLDADSNDIVPGTPPSKKVFHYV